ncbi:MAG TPA: glycosyltransferase family 2 protein [Candidatus Hydrogenedentes bacterium]|nr:glycosyltransferase family 2 protein [Candidatus Hydrogenedentota bacterium]HOV72886.1 glycosyltransferase family 2 protein [Candidatus Hydrogenedentota bacterium]HPC16423.1 glycosyltransferase family 2 protein [Candidatus Hydrogenedentota bacterium]HRT20356.1 glycosyltransferase family 2 protein [Candidatus Hydrogenedentota bacterium]HRT65082.1 glycosyltransferase family 2 protein [Candidatus Hydrogenedentota bacterium]
MSTITVLTLVPNAGDRLPRCLESVQWADDIFCVVDPATTDGSDEVARRYTSHVVTHEFINHAAQENWALEQIQTEWTLILDADEWVTEELASRIRQIIRDPASHDLYYIRRLSYFLGRQIRHCGWDRDYNSRLFRTRKGRNTECRAHPRIVVDGTVGRIHEPMLHDAYRSFPEFFRTLTRYTTWGAQDAYERGRRAGVVHLTLRPFWRFFSMYVLRRGFLDGYHGLILSALYGVSVFVKYAKLWYIERLARENRCAPGEIPDPDAPTRPEGFKQ